DGVHGHTQPILGIPEAPKCDPPHEISREIERRRTLLERNAADLLVLHRRRRSSQVREGDAYARCCMDQLFAAVARSAIRAAQDGVPCHDLVEGAPQGVAIERAGEAQRDRRVVSGADAFEMVEEPQALLRERERVCRRFACVARTAATQVVDDRVFVFGDLRFELGRKRLAERRVGEPAFLEIQRDVVGARLLDDAFDVAHQNTPSSTIFLSGTPMRSSGEREAAAIRCAMASMRGASKKARIVYDVALSGNTSLTRPRSRVASSESPPSAKKSSLTPIPLTPNSSSQIAASRCSISVRGCAPEVPCRFGTTGASRRTGLIHFASRGPSGANDTTTGVPSPKPNDHPSARVPSAPVSHVVSPAAAPSSSTRHPSHAMLTQRVSPSACRAWTNASPYAFAPA